MLLVVRTVAKERGSCVFCVCRYLRERFGGEEVNVEHKKKENRSETGFLTNMADYLDVSLQTSQFIVMVSVGVLELHIHTHTHKIT